MSLMSLWPHLAVNGLVVVVFWAWMHARYKKRLTVQKARHVQSQQTSSRLMLEAKRQVAQLNKDLAAARLAVKLAVQARAAPARVPAAVTQTSRRVDMPTTRTELPVDGFADTLPSLQFSADKTFGLH
jgi:hypothetical protein